MSLLLLISGNKYSQIISGVVDYSTVDYVGTVTKDFQNITTGEASTYYYGWPITYAVQDKRGMFYRKGSTHIYSPSEIVKYESDDGAATFTRTVIHSEADMDCRNYGGGNTSTGIIILFFARYNASSDFVSIRRLRSTDGGATFSESADLTLYTGVTHYFSPHGRMIELENGDLIQAFYGENGSATTYIWTLKSTDNGVTWGSPVLIASGTALYEPDLVYLGEGKIIAVIRHDIASQDVRVEVYNSSDSGETYTAKGQATWNGLYAYGVSPCLLKIDGDNASLIQTARASVNNFHEATLPFGTNITTGITRRFFDAGQGMDANNIDFGYLRPLSFNSTLEDTLGTWYNTSEEWVSGFPHFTDIWVGPIFRKTLVQTSRISGTVTPSGFDYAPQSYHWDEIPSYNNDSNTYHHIIRETGNYDVRVEVELSGAGGTTRTVDLEKWTRSPEAFVGTIQSVTQAGNSFDFTEPGIAMTAGQSFQLSLDTDATSLDITLIRLTIQKV